MMALSYLVVAVHICLYIIDNNLQFIILHITAHNPTFTTPLFNKKPHA